MNYTLIKYAQNTAKSHFFCITSFFLNEFEYAHEIHSYWICPNLHRQKHHSYVWQIHRPNPHPIILLPMGDGNAAFRLASNLKTAWLGSIPPVRGITHADIVFRVMEEHKKKKTFFWLLQSYFTNGGSLMCGPPGLKYLQTTKREAGMPGKCAYLVFHLSSVWEWII